MRRWTTEERDRQAKIIQIWQPWKQSTGPKTDNGKAASALNAIKHGFRSSAVIGDVKSLKGIIEEQRTMIDMLR